MAAELGVDDGAFRYAQDQISSVHDDLRDEHRSLSETMTSLLDGGWSGEAASEYADGWADWETGCALVLDGLASMNATMGSVLADLNDTDARQGGSMDHLVSRLGGLT